MSCNQLSTGSVSAILLIIALFIMGCDKADNDSLPPHVRSLEPLVIPDPSNPVFQFVFERQMLYSDSLLLDEITALATDAAGNLYAAGSSWKRNEVHVFSADGVHQNTIGGYGSDDGSFLDISALVTKNTVLHVFDRELGRRTYFSIADGELLGVSEHLPDLPAEVSDDDDFDLAAPVRITNSGGQITEYRQDLNPAYYTERKVIYLKGDKNGGRAFPIAELRDTLFLVGDYAGRPAPFTLRYPSHSLIAFLDDGHFYTAWSDELLIRKFDPAGNFLKAYYYPYERAGLNRDLVIHPAYSHNDQLLRIRESAEYPEFWPAIASMLADDEGRIWVALIHEDKSRLEWWILQDGITGRFSWPSDSQIKHISGGHIYAVENDDTGFRDVVRYGYRLEPADSTFRQSSP
jgi:hypothetical protein